MAGEINSIIIVAQAEDGPAEDGHAESGAAAAADGHETTAGTEHETGVFPPFDVSTFPSQLLWFALTFAALYMLMSRVALPRIGEILEVRRDRIETDLAEAERLRRKTDKAIEDYEAELASARRKSHAIAEETRGSIKKEIGAAHDKAEAELAKKVAAAEAAIAETKNAALANVDEVATQTASTIVAQLVGKSTAKEARDAVAAAIKQ